MEITSDTPVMPVIFTSASGNPLTKSCLLLLRTEHPSMEQAVRALVDSVTEWAKTTEEGKGLFKACRYNITIADLAATDVFSNTDLRRIMLEHGLEFVACHGTYCEANIEFDRNLVHYTQCIQPMHWRHSHFKRPASLVCLTA